MLSTAYDKRKLKESFHINVCSNLLITCLSILQCKLVWWKDMLWFLQLSEKGPHGWGEDWNHAYRSCYHQEIWVACLWFLVWRAEISESLWKLRLGMFDTLLCIYQSVDRGWCINNFQDDTGSQKDKVIVKLDKSLTLNTVGHFDTSSTMKGISD